MIERFRTRLRRLEKKSPHRNVILKFRNGSQRAIHIADPLGALCEGMTRQAAQLGPVEGDELPIGMETRPKLVPESASPETCALLDLMGQATAVISDDPLPHLIWGLARGHRDEPARPARQEPPTINSES